MPEISADFLDKFERTNNLAFEWMQDLRAYGYLHDGPMLGLQDCLWEFQALIREARGGALKIMAAGGGHADS